MKKSEKSGKRLNKAEQKIVIGGKNKACGVLGEPCLTGSYGLCCNNFVCNNNVCEPLVP